MKSKAHYAAKQRNAFTRKRKPIILLATEGKNKTEEQYFRDFARQFDRTVRFVSGDYTDPVNMVRVLIQKYHEDEMSPDYGDKGYCLVDSDFVQSKNEQIACADKMAAQNNCEVLVSSPCFEIWFLCHYGATTKHFRTNREVLDEVRKKYTGYEKNMPGMFEATKDKLQDAIRNAEILRNRCEKNGYKFHTVEFLPSTEIYLLARILSQ